MCGMPDFRMQTDWFGHWIPAFAGMTNTNPPYAIALYFPAWDGWNRVEKRVILVWCIWKFAQFNVWQRRIWL